MAYGKNKGRFRETRVGRFAGNMGAAEAPVKSTDIDGVPDRGGRASKKLQNTPCSCTLKKSILGLLHGVGRIFLSKSGKRRKSPSSGRHGGSQGDDPIGDGGPDEATAFIAETVADLARMARRHRLGMLVRLLEMAQLEAEERVRLRSKRRLS
jgi:hypothetical protein